MARSPFAEHVRHAIRTRHLSLRTERAYVQWIRRFILYHDARHPKQMGAPEIQAFLTYLAVERNVAASTQNQARSALLFLFREVLGRNPGALEKVVSARRSRRVPVVFSQPEVRAVLAHMQRTNGLVGRLLYGAGLRLIESLRLCIKDVDFAHRRLVVRDGKGAKDRLTMIPATLEAPLLRHPPARKRCGHPYRATPARAQKC